MQTSQWREERAQFLEQGGHVPGACWGSPKVPSWAEYPRQVTPAEAGHGCGAENLLLLFDQKAGGQGPPLKRTRITRGLEAERGQAR